MKYFVNNDQRSGTCYHEFYKGKWDESTFWASDSILLHDDILYEAAEFAEAIAEIIPVYDPYGETEIYPEQWKMIGERVCKSGNQMAVELYFEANEWVQDVFPSYGCFTIIGI